MSVLANKSEYLASTEVIDWQHPSVRQLADQLAVSESESIGIARKCFEWVRDEIQHSMDFRRSELTCRASDVLLHRTGFCYAKSHLLAALLRANEVPAGFCYQRLTLDCIGPPFSLHGLNAIWLDEFGWYRIDARGNKTGVDAQFSPPVEQLAFPVQHPGEFALKHVYSNPLPIVVEALNRFDTADELVKNLPDITPDTLNGAGKDM